MAMKKERFDELYNKYMVAQWPDELFWMVNKVESLNPHTIIEIGVERGGSLKFWEQVVEPEDLVIGVDINPKVGTSFIQWAWRNSDRNMKIVIGDSTKDETVGIVRKHLAGRKVNFLFIDGDHKGDSPMLDFKRYVSFVRSGGIVGFHDIWLELEPRNLFRSLEGKKERAPPNPKHTPNTGIWWNP